MSHLCKLILLVAIAMSMCAHAQKVRKYSFDFDFSGLTWQKKETIKIAGPGNNFWSGDLVQRTETGVKLLRTTRGSNSYGAEMKTVKDDFGYGLYLIQTIGRIDQLHDQTVFGFFLFDHHQRPHGEIDIEYSKWGGQSMDNAHYSVHPNKGVTKVENSVSAAFAMNGEHSTHIMKVTKEGVYFGSFQGHVNYSRRLLSQMTFVSGRGIDLNNNMTVHLNFWNFGKTNSKENSYIEVTKFSYSKKH